MGLRVSRQAVDVIGQKDSNLRVATQAVEVLATTDPDLRVFQVAVEYLRTIVTGPQIHTVGATSAIVLSQDNTVTGATREASSALSLGQSGDYVLIELPATIVSLSLGQSAVATLDQVKEGTSTVVAGQTASYDRVRNRSTDNQIELLHEASYVGPKELFAISSFLLGQFAHVAQTYNLFASSSLTLSDVAATSTNSVAAESIIVLAQVADTIIKIREAVSQINVTQVASVEKILTGTSQLSLTQHAQPGAISRLVVSPIDLTQEARFAPLQQSAESQIDLSQFAETSIRFISVSSQLTLVQEVSVQKPIRANAENDLIEKDWLPDPVTGDVTLQDIGLRDEASVIASGGHYAEHLMSFRQTVGLTHVRVSGTSVSASSSLMLSQGATTNETGFAGNVIDLMHSAVGWGGRPGNSQLELTQEAIVSPSRAFSGTDIIPITQAAAYTLIIGSSRCQYSPFVGESSDPNAPTPPPEAIQGPMPGIQVPFQLVYPSVGTVTDAVSLKAPNLGNLDRLSFNRVQKETRGGTLIVYADPIWPKVETLILSFSGLKRVEAQELLAFMDNHLGLEIGLIDWEHRFWRGIIVSPDEPAVEDSFDSYTAGFQFQGVLDPSWNPQVVPPSLRYSAIRTPQQDGYYCPNEPMIPFTPETLDFYEAEAGSTIKIGYPLYLSGNIVNPAQANAAGTTQVVGISISDAVAGTSCQYLSEGRVERTDWTEITGNTTLSPGATYFLSPSTPGWITTMAPTTASQYVVRVGRAVDTLTLDVEIELPILL